MTEATRPERVEVLHRERLVDDYFKLDAVQYRFERFDGRLSAPVRRLVLERGDSAAALLLDDAGRVLLAEQFRIAAHGAGPGWLLELVAGVVAVGETPEQTLRREVYEEAGLELGALEPLGSYYLSPGGSSERVHLFVAPATARRGPGGGLAAEGEDIRIVALDRAALRRAWQDGRIVDAKTALALLAHFGGRP